MYLKERIDRALKELNEKYRPKDKAKGAAKPLIEQLYDIKLPRHKIGFLIRQIESVYGEHTDPLLRPYPPWNIS